MSFYQDAHHQPGDLVVLGLLIILGMQMLIGSGIVYLLLQILTPETPRPAKDEAKKNLMGE